MEKQAELKSCDMPSLKVSDIEIKERVLFKDIDALIKKVRMWRPPKEKKEKKKKEKKEEKEGSGETIEINADDEEATEKPKEEEEPATEAPPETTEEPVTHDSAEL